MFQDVATPLTNTHYLGAQRGAMYSAEHNLERFHAEAVARNRCNTPVKNLYLSGETPPPAQETNTGISQSASFIGPSASSSTCSSTPGELQIPSRQKQMKSAKEEQLSGTSVCQPGSSSRRSRGVAGPSECNETLNEIKSQRDSLHLHLIYGIAQISDIIAKTKLR